MKRTLPSHIDQTMDYLLRSTTESFNEFPEIEILKLTTIGLSASIVSHYYHYFRDKDRSQEPASVIRLIDFYSPVAPDGINLTKFDEEFSRAEEELTKEKPCIRLDFSGLLFVDYIFLSYAFRQMEHKKQHPRNSIKLKYICVNIENMVVLQLVQAIRANISRLSNIRSGDDNCWRLNSKYETKRTGAAKPIH